MQVRLTFKQGGRVATGTGSCATEAQRHEKDKTWALLGKRCPASPLGDEAAQTCHPVHS